MSIGMCTCGSLHCKYCNPAIWQESGMINTDYDRMYAKETIAELEEELAEMETEMAKLRGRTIWTRAIVNALGWATGVMALLILMVAVR